MPTTGAQPVKIAPSVFIWARESMGMSHTDVANKLKKTAYTVLGGRMAKYW